MAKDITIAEGIFLLFENCRRNVFTFYCQQGSPNTLENTKLLLYVILFFEFEDKNKRLCVILWEAVQQIMYPNKRLYVLLWESGMLSFFMKHCMVLDISSPEPP